MSNQFKVGDVVVSRTTGPFEHYIIGTLERNTSGTLSFRYQDNDAVFSAAMVKAEALKSENGDVFPMVDPAAATPAAPAKPAGFIESAPPAIPPAPGPIQNL